MVIQLFFYDEFIAPTYFQFLNRNSNTLFFYVFYLEITRRSCSERFSI